MNAQALTSPSDKPSAQLAPVDRYKRMTVAEVMDFLGVKSRNTVWSRVKNGKLPKPVYIDKDNPRWVFGDVLDKLHELEQPMDAVKRGMKNDPEVKVAQAEAEAAQQENKAQAEGNAAEEEVNKNAAARVFERFGFGRNK